MNFARIFRQLTSPLIRDEYVGEVAIVVVVVVVVVVVYASYGWSLASLWPPSSIYCGINARIDAGKEEAVVVTHGRDEDDERLMGMIWRAKVAKAVTEAIIVAACVFWVLWWFVAPDPEGDKKYVESWIGDKSHSRFFRTDGREGKPLIINLKPDQSLQSTSYK